MTFLVTNDDGFEAEGLNVLSERLSREHRVFVIAPDGNRSAISHGITIYEPLRLRCVRKDVWACSGKPADCSAVAIKSDFLPEKIDAVISGINHGANLGTDVVYSGTCGAAREAVLCGVPAIAVSLEAVSGKIERFDVLADFIARNIEKLVSLSDAGEKSTFVNVNALSLTEYKGAVLTHVLSSRKYDSGFSVSKDGDEYVLQGVGGNLLHSFSEDSDNGLSERGYIAISCIHAEPWACKVDGIDFSL